MTPETIIDENMSRGIRFHGHSISSPIPIIARTPDALQPPRQAPLPPNEGFQLVWQVSSPSDVPSHSSLASSLRDPSPSHEALQRREARSEQLSHAQRRPIVDEGSLDLKETRTLPALPDCESRFRPNTHVEALSAGLERQQHLETQAIESSQQDIHRRPDTPVPEAIPLFDNEVDQDDTVRTVPRFNSHSDVKSPVQAVAQLEHDGNMKPRIQAVPQLEHSKSVDLVVNLPVEIKEMIKRVRCTLFESYTETQHMEALMKKSGDRLARGGFSEEKQLLKPEAWLRKQTDEVQKLWEHISTIERMLTTGKQEAIAMKDRISLIDA